MTEFYWGATRLLPALVGALLLLGCIVLLHRAWLGRLRTGPWPAWALITGGLTSWTLAGHALITAPMGVVLLMLIALGWIAMRGSWGSARARTMGTAASDGVAPGVGGTATRNWKRALNRTLIMGPLAALSACAVSLAVAARLPGSDTDRGVAGLFLLIMLWAAALVWTAADSRLRRPAAGLGIAALLAGLSLLLLSA